MSDELALLGEDCARDARTYLTSVREVASGSAPDTAIPVLLLAVSQVISMGARLGAITDVVPDERFEADSGPEADLDPLRTGLANLFEGLDEYAHVFDPLVGVQVVKGALSNDLADIAAALDHGLQHHDAGRVVEALWWWQFSYLQAWGDAAARALRVILAILGHLRLDADEETVADAEFDALHP